MRKAFDFIRSDIGRIVIGCALFVSALIVDYVDRASSFSLRALIIYVLALMVAGIPVFIDAVKGIIRKDLLDEKFLMSIASVGAMLVGEWREGVAVMLFFLVGEYFEHKAVSKTRRSIRSLMNIRPDEASVLIDGVEELLDADDVAVGSVIVIRAGERVPIDSIVIDGSADIDTSALTGESIPRSVSEGSVINSGVVVLNGVIKARTTCLADESAAARILDLVENANERKSRAENFITRFSHFYTPIVVGLAILIAIIPPIFELTSFSEALYRALIFLVISCPCALVISVPMAFFAGIGGAASQGILYKGGNVFAPLAKADTFVFDKTGTLTEGKFEVKDVVCFGIERDKLIALAASAEYGSNHPLASCIKAQAPEAKPADSVREIAGKGVIAIVDGVEIAVGSDSFIKEIDAEAEVKNLPHGAVSVAVSGRFSGYIVMADKLRGESESAMKSLRKAGVRKLVMLSGDKREIAESVGATLGLDNVYSELLPENKYEKLEKIIEESQGTVYVGDGINDAPSLALADVGIAMGGIGQDSAIEAADVVLMTDDLKRIPTAVKISKRTLRIARENIVFALGVKLSVLLFGAIGFADMWLAVFADVGVAVLAILNSMRALRKMNDR